MNKKLFVLFALAILILPIVMAKDVAYIVKDDKKPNTEFISSLNKLGLTYDVIDDSKIPTTVFGDYDFILIGNENIENKALIPLNTKKSLISNYRFYSDWGSTYGSYASNQAASVTLTNLNSPISLGIPEIFKSYVSTVGGPSLPLHYFKVAKAGVTSVAYADGKKTQITVASKQNPKRIFFGITETNYWSDETRKLFENSLVWVSEKEISPAGAPILIQEIPDLSWEQGGSEQINLSNYFKDPENKPLTFAHHSSSSTDLITLSLNNSIATFSSPPNWTGTGWIIFQASNSFGQTLSNLINLRVGTPETPTDRNFSDVTTCEIKDSALSITIRNPSSRTEFSPGDEIDGRVRVRNSVGEDLDVDLRIYLYDLTEDEEIEDTKESIDVDKGKSEDLDFVLKIPSDVKNNKFALLVVAEGENGRDYCNFEHIELTIKREKNKIEFSSLTLNPTTVKPGEIATLTAKISNIGTRDQDVFVKVSNSALALLQQTEEFELERFDKDDTETKTFTIRVPENAEEGEYNILVQAFYDNEKEDESKFITLIVSKQTSGTSEGTPIFQNDPIKLSKTAETTSSKTTGQSVLNLNFNSPTWTQNDLLLLLDIFLVGGIIIILILVFNTKKK